MPQLVVDILNELLTWLYSNSRSQRYRSRGLLLSLFCREDCGTAMSDLEFQNWACHFFYIYIERGSEWLCGVRTRRRLKDYVMLALHYLWGWWCSHLPCWTQVFVKFKKLMLQDPKYVHQVPKSGINRPIIGQSPISLWLTLCPWKGHITDNFKSWWAISRIISFGDIYVHLIVEFVIFIWHR